MADGLSTPNRSVPKQDMKNILMHAERFARAAEAQRDWATTAKKCVEYFEDKQWAAEDLRKLQQQGRPALTINKIKPLVNLVLGFHLNNRTDIRYLPGHDGSGSAPIAETLSHLAKQIADQNELQFIDAEVYLDGILGGRGYYDWRLDFERNDFGDVSVSPIDPFSVYIDPDATHYDPKKWNYVMTTRMVSVDEVEHHYGKQVSGLVAPLIDGKTPGQIVGPGIYEGWDEIHPFRSFGGEIDSHVDSMMGPQFYDWIDRQRKTVRMLDIQYYIPTWRWFFIDVETGDKRIVPEHWDERRIQTAIEWSMEAGQPVMVQKRSVRRLRQTQMIGDVIVHDDWSAYESPTIVPFFPYFRRGQTMGMVSSLIDSQNEINKRRSARLNTINRQSNGLWVVQKGSLSPEERENLENHGSRPGTVVEYEGQKQGVPMQPPRQEFPGQDNTGQAALEKEAEDDLKVIAGINDSALGNLDKVQSGRAIEARQRQTIVGLEGFQVNYSRTKKLCGRKQLELIQNFYSEERIVRVRGDHTDSQEMHKVVINQRTAEGIANNVTIGTYEVSVSESPMSKTFLEGQFEELLRLKELMVPVPDEFIVDASSIGRKDELKEGLRQMREMEAQQAAAEGAADGNGNGAGPGPGGSQVDAAGGSLPNGEPGQPPFPTG